MIRSAPSTKECSSPRCQFSLTERLAIRTSTKNAPAGQRLLGLLNAFTRSVFVEGVPYSRP